MEGIDQTLLPQHEWAPSDSVDLARRVRRHTEESDRAHPDRNYRFKHLLDVETASGCGGRADGEGV